MDALTIALLAIAATFLIQAFMLFAVLVLTRERDKQDRTALRHARAHKR